MNKIILGILLGIVLLPACKKSGPIEYRIDDNLKAHFNYQVGSYWVYKDSLTGEEDSFYVMSNVFSTVRANEEEIYDGITINIKQQKIYPFNPADTSIWSLGFGNLNTLQLMWINNKSKHLNVGVKIWYSSIPYPFAIGALQASVNSFGYLKNIYPSYPINGNNFNTVAEINDTFNIDNSVDIYNYSDWLYLNDSVGIVKMSLFHPEDSVNRVWEIERWKVIK